MKNKKWGILLAVFSVVCMMAMSLTGFAAGPLDGQVVDGSLLTSESHSEVRKELTVESGSEIAPYGSYLSYGTAAIADYGGGSINFNGSTVCYRMSDYVTVSLTLQRLIDGYWRDYISRSYTEYDTAGTSAGYNVTVPTGYYYRVKGIHKAVKGSVTESTTSYTDGVYIG